MASTAGTGTMEICVNGRFLSQRITGAQRYAHEVLLAIDEQLSKSPSSAPIEMLVPSSVTEIPKYQFFTVRKVGKWSGQVWEQLELPFYTRGRLLFTPVGGAPLAHAHHVITIHDAAVYATPNAYSFAFRNWYQFLYKRLASKAHFVLTDSQFSKDELARCCEVEASKFVSIYLGSEHIFKQARDLNILSKHKLEGRRFILAVSSRNPNKNFHGVVDAIRLLDLKNIQFVVAGARNSKVFEESLQLPESVIEVGFVTDAELRTLYEAAACFVFPSFYEGFGLPPLEALALGCPVVASATASMPEVLGDVVFYCDPSKPEDIAEQIQRAIDTPPDRENNMKHAAKFTWEKCAAQTWEVVMRASGR